MVALQSARRPFLVVALLLAVTLTPLVPTGQAQSGVYDIVVHPDTVAFEQFGMKTHYLRNGTASLFVEFSNAGVSAVSGVGVFAYVPAFGDRAYACGYEVLATGATRTSPGLGLGANGSADARKAVRFDFEVPPNVQARDYNYTVIATKDPAAAPEVFDPNPASPHPCGLTPNGATQVEAKAGSTAGAAADNTVNAYFLKEKRVDYYVADIHWVWGRVDVPHEHAIHTVTPGGTNVTYEQAQTSRTPRPTHFEVRVLNGGNATPGQALNYSGRDATGGRPFPFELFVTANGPGLDADTGLNWTTRMTDGVGFYKSQNFTLEAHGGAFDVNATLWQDGEMDAKNRTLVVRAPDIVPEIDPTGLKTDASDPYPYVSGTTISGTIRLWNNGTANITGGAAVGNQPGFHYRIYLENATSHFDTGRLSTLDYTVNALNFGTKVDKTFSWTFSTTSTAVNYLPRGRYDLVVEVDDRAGGPYELDEGNNQTRIPIYVKDETDPAVSGVTVNGTGGVTVTTVHPHENFTVRATVTDDDILSLNVTAVFQNNDNTSLFVNRSMKLVRYETCVARQPVTNDCTEFAYSDRWTANVTDFPWANATNRSTTTWTMRVRAEDAFLNVGESAPITLTVKKWPIHTVPAGYIWIDDPDSGVYTLRDNETFNYSGDEHVVIKYRIRVLTNETGIHDQHKNATNSISNTSNLKLEYTTPDGTTHVRGGDFFTDETDCPTQTELEAKGEATIECRFKGEFLTDEIDRHNGGPGLWNVSILIADKTGEVRRVNRSFTILDQLPIVEEVKFNLTEVPAGDSFEVVANLSDDFEIREAYVEFNRTSDGLVLNYTLVDPAAPFSLNDRKYYEFNNTFHTGAGKMFGVAGEFRVNISALDSTGKWTRSQQPLFKVVDGDAPVIERAGPIPALQEVGSNVTFYAVIQDATNSTAEVQLQLGDAIVRRLTLTDPDGDGNYTVETNFTNEANYVWTVTAEDSVGNDATSVRSGTLSIRSNLGPRFEVRSPRLVILGDRYAPAQPTIELFAYDTDGVVESTINLSIDGQAVAATTQRQDNGIVVSYAVPASRAYAHDANFTVNITATDFTALRGWLELTFKVDAQAPVSRMSSFEPRHRAAEGHVWNVSLDTRFTLAADDDDGMPTTVEGVWFRVLGGGNAAAETKYTGPFTLEQIAGVYTGPRLYQIQFYGVDDVGNEERPLQSLTVFVDNAPPALDPFGSLPQGRFVNATFRDDCLHPNGQGCSGVDRAVAWWRHNSNPFQLVPLEANGTVWSAVLPEGKKGDRLEYYLQAWDGLNNTQTFGNATEPYHASPVGNHLPTIRITSPAMGSRVGRLVDLGWEAADQDGDALTFAIYYKAPGRAGFTELARLESPDTRKYALDTSRYADGEYTFRVTASDGSFVALAETTFTIANRASPFGAPSQPPSEVDPGRPVLLKVEITKAQATVVEARVFRDGELVGSYAMNDEGRDGDEVANDNVYSVRVSFDAAGDYKVQYFTQYQEDGVLKESSLDDAAAFSVAVTPGYVVDRYGWLLAALGLAAVAAIGVAVFALMRKRG